MATKDMEEEVWLSKITCKVIALGQQNQVTREISVETI